MKVTAKAISGFKEFLPEEQVLFNRMMDVIRRHYELFGFAPLETAAVERNDVLLAKADEENRKVMYGLHILNSSNTGHVENVKNYALHFDQTVPLARYVAQNYGKLVFPFRRYQMQKVWRGERPQDGRFREFYQCDIDVVGDESLGLLHDAEMPAVIHGIFSELGIGKFLIRLGNRKIHNGLLENLGIPLHYNVKRRTEPGPDWDGGTTEDTRNTLTLIDKLHKDGVEKTRRAFQDDVGVSEEKVDELLTFLAHKDDVPATLKWLANQERNDMFALGVSEITEVIDHMQALGVPSNCFAIDFGITRGLDYYTGTVYETTLVNHEAVGSVCSGGRFDDLASTFIDRKLPGVGISIGLTRLFTVLQKSGVIRTGPHCPTKVVIFNMTPELRHEYFAMATNLRTAGIPAEVYLEDKNVNKQTKYAVKKQIPFGIFMDEDRHERGVCTVRHYNNGDEAEVSLTQLPHHLHQL